LVAVIVVIIIVIVIIVIVVIVIIIVIAVVFGGRLFGFPFLPSSRYVLMSRKP
jgi:hypothetical protein